MMTTGEGGRGSKGGGEAGRNMAGSLDLPSNQVKSSQRQRATAKAKAQSMVN